MLATGAGQWSVGGGYLQQDKPYMATGHHKTQDGLHTCTNSHFLLTFPLLKKSSSLPGVPTTMLQPLSTCCSWWPTEVPPYTTTGRYTELYTNFLASP